MSDPEPATPPHPTVGQVVLLRDAEGAYRRHVVEAAAQTDGSLVITVRAT